jgi:multidrug efflux pump subunit AcrA (membrane-fusion protein)
LYRDYRNSSISARIKTPTPESSRAARADDRPVREVKPGKIRFELIARGYLGPSRAQVFRSEVEGRATIISLRPDGSQVKKGELICELDSSAFKEKLVNQTITTRSAEASYQEPKLALKENVEGALEDERLTLKTTIASAEAAVRDATGRLEARCARSPRDGREVKSSRRTILLRSDDIDSD